jgi:hypothetical protein
MEDGGIFSAHLVYFMASWCSVYMTILYTILLFPPFWYVVPPSDNPVMYWLRRTERILLYISFRFIHLKYGP